MSCPIILTNAGADVTIDDLAELTILGAATADITDMFSVECIANSTDLQALLTSGDITMTYAGDPITDLGDLCVTPGELATFGFATWNWQAGRRGTVSASVDLVRFDRGSTFRSPFVAERNLEVIQIVARDDNFANNYSLRFLISTNNGTTWVNAVPDEAIAASPTIIATTFTMNQGDLLRVRFINTNGVVRSPQVSILVRETA